MTIPALSVCNLDPQGNINELVRALGAPILTGTVSTDTDFGQYGRWLYVGTTGNLSYVKWDGTTQALANIAAGVWHPIAAVRVNSSGTTAGSLVWGA